MPDPRLKEAMEEIKAVIKKYDIAATVHLQSPGYSEFLYELSPTWSAITVEENYLRIKAAAKTGGPKEQERLRLSVSIVMGFLDAGKHQTENMQAAAGMLIRNGVKFNHITTNEQ